MTKREFLNAIAAGEMTEEVIAFANEEIEKMDAANAKRREKNAERKAQNDEFVDLFVSFLNDEPKTASDIMALMGEVERPDGKAVNVQWVSSLGRKAVEAERAAKVDVKVTGKGTQKGYVACQTITRRKRERKLSFFYASKEKI